MTGPIADIETERANVDKEATALAYALFQLRKLCRHWVTPKSKRASLVANHWSVPNAVFLTDTGIAFFRGTTVADMTAYQPPRMSDNVESELARHHVGIVRQYIVDAGHRFPGDRS